MEINLQMKNEIRGGNGERKGNCLLLADDHSFPVFYFLQDGGIGARLDSSILFSQKG